MSANEKKTQQTEVVSTRTTFDGVTVYLHANGAVSSRMEFLRRKLRPTIMWRAWQDVCLYTWRELSAFVDARNARERLQRPHHHSRQCARCGGRNLPAGYIAAAPRYAVGGVR